MPKLPSLTPYTVGEASVFEFDEVESTNSVAIGFASALLPSFTVISAHRQTKGVGSRGRSWISQQGNIFASLILRHTEYDGTMDQLGVLVSLALSRAIGAVVAPAATRIKWPNDILVEGKKVCGILIQEGIPISTEQVPMKAAWYVIGFGINVENCPLELEPKVGALHRWNSEITSRNLLARCLVDLQNEITGFEQVRFERIVEEWVARAIGMGEVIDLKFEGKSTSAKLIGITPSGDALLELSGGKRLERRKLYFDIAATFAH